MLTGGVGQDAPGVGSSDETGDLDEVVVEDAVTDPGAGAGESVDARAVETEVPFGAADASLAAGSPSDHLLERLAVLDVTARRGRLAFAGQHDVADTGGVK